MSKYKTWNIRDLLAENVELNAEIAARIQTVEMMENNFQTYTPNGKAEDYKTLIEAAIELLRKGQKNEN